MKGHLTHMVMCAPMLVIAIVLIIGGAGALAVLVPVLGCVLMMAVMMRLMGGHGHAHGHAQTRDRGTSAS